MLYRKTTEVLTEAVALADKLVLDVGCGDGALARVMAGLGAHVVGVETSAVQLTKARATPRVADEAYCLGCGEALPMAEGVMDVVTFSNSLHHVPVQHQYQALAEAARVLKTGGLVFVSEPIADGPHFTLNRRVEDETHVRAMALAAIGRAGQWGLTQTAEVFYTQATRFADFDAWRQRQIAVDAERAARLAKHEAELRDAFTALGQHDEQGWRFDQPMRVNLLRKG